MCDCIKKVNKDLPNDAGLRTLTNAESGQFKVYIPVHRVKEKDTFISPKYCPFCGERYDEKE